MRGPGFGASLLGFVRTLADVPPLNEAELIVDCLHSPEPPAFCPCCCFPALEPSRDADGAWTWNCFGGCNP